MRITTAMLTLAALATLPDAGPIAESEAEPDGALVFGDGFDLAIAEFGYDDADYDDFGDLDDEYDDDDFGDDVDGNYYMDDDDDGDDGDEFGAIEDRIRRRRRRARRAAGRGNHSRAGRLRGSARELDERRRRRRGGGEAQPNRRRRQPKKIKMMKALVSLGGTVAAAGSTTQQVVVQHHFIAEDITFAGSTAAATVTSIFFGDTVIWTNAVGIDISVFATGGFMRGFLKGSKLQAGLTITINGTVAGAGDTFKAVLTGWKPATGRC